MSAVLLLVILGLLDVSISIDLVVDNGLCGE